ncbi:hypothetical protein V2J09_022708 [Rumex salicifolius]
MEATDPDNPFSVSCAGGLSEDTVFYAIYPDFALSPPIASTPDLTEQLLSLHLQLLHSVSPFTASYIWQHQPFSLSPSSASNPCLCSSSGEAHVPHLHGKLRFGDNLDDEWFVVFLLFHLSRSFSFLSARVWDYDGDFLLIESAYHLPLWVNPETSANRVFIRNNELHIIPRRRFPSTPSLQDALACLISNSSESRTSDSIQAAINNRLSGYPERAKKNIHKVRVRVPVEVAKVLKYEPCLISLAVEGFYDRDIDAMKFASEMKRFCPKGKAEELVTVSATLSRAMYAQLVQQKFQAPKCYPMPSRGTSQVYVEAELGMKVACGFEMMYQQRKKVGDEGKGSTWETFKESLQKSGYFQDLMPGSKEYKRLMATAEEYYRKSSLHQRFSETLSAPVRRIDEILSMLISVEDFNGQKVPPSDDDSWLYDGEDELNAAMMERQKEFELYEERHRKKNKGKATDISSSTDKDNFDLKDISKNMQAFVQKVSSYQGAEVAEDRNLLSVDFDVDQFMKDMESALRVTNAEGDESGVDFEDGSSSDMNFDDSEDGGDTEELPESNEQNGEPFMQTYSDVLNEELNGSTLKKSFVRACDQSLKKDEVISKATEDMDTDFSPVDVDVNLVKSLLDSFSSQQGLPGPASNLMGLMGLKLPKDDSAKK